MQKQRDRIEDLLTQGLSHDSPELVQSVKEYSLLQSQFATLEAQFQETKADFDS